MKRFDLRKVRDKHLAELRKSGFLPASSLPWVRSAELRPLADVAKRLLAVKTCLAWVCSGESQAPSSQIASCIDRHGLTAFMGERERAMVGAPREEATARFVDDIGWSFEGAWSLAWILGYAEPPDIRGRMMDQDKIAAVVLSFAPRLAADLPAWLAERQPRSEAEVLRLEDLFYCVHNAGRSALLGGKTVPPSFDPQAGTAVVQERRQGLTWALSPGVSWDETDLST
jgi:hypothetical protein